jgi:uncharacterized membrane protein YfcA
MNSIKSKWTYLASGGILFSSVTILNILLYIYLGWWTVLLSTLIGVYVGHRHFSELERDTIKQMLAGLGIAKH